MPYRAELKRPDLKGQFPCSVCGKIFCHSSSLSRHRMQAHFKSYTCTICDQEIASNETLRSHMFRAHQISRMFMCRCCNWAFPDKTSLHIHMQSMMRHGVPGDVNILAKSSNEGDEPNQPIPMSPSMMKEGPSSPLTPTSLTAHNNNNNNSGNGIFPAMPSREELLNRLRSKSTADSPQTPQMPQLPFNNLPLGTQSLLASWLANNFPAAARNGLGQSAPSATPPSGLAGCRLDDSKLTDQSDDGALEIRMDESDGSDVFDPSRDYGNGTTDVDGIVNAVVNGAGQPKRASSADNAIGATPMSGSVAKVEPTEMGGDDDALPILRSAITANPLNSLMYRKKLNSALRNRTAAQDSSLANFLATASPAKQGDGLATDDGSPSIHQLFPPPSNSGTPGATGPQPPHDNQASPSGASDSQTSSSGAPLSAGSEILSPHKCFECQVLKGKLGVSENRNKYLDSKVTNLENKISRLESQIQRLESSSTRYEGEHRAMREQCEILERKLLACQEKAIRYLQQGENTSTMKGLLEDLLECTYVQAAKS